MKEISDVEAILWDWDGPIVDSVNNIMAAYNHLYENGLSNLQFGTKEEFLLFFDTDYTNNAQALGWDTNEKMEQALNVYSAFFATLQKSELIQEGIIEILNEISPQYKMGVATNMDNTHNRVEEIMQMHSIETYFSTIVGRNNTQGLQKPDPAIVNTCLYELSIHKSNAIFIGDSPNDILAGKRAGVYTIAIGWGLSKKEKLLQSNPDIYCHTADELLEVLKK